MSSSFRRASRPIENETRPHGNAPLTSKLVPFSTAKTVLERVGTKPSKGGLTLTSSGLRELDAIIGGGQPLGTAILIEEDRWTQDLALALARYWSAEAVSQQQNLFLVATAPDDVDISKISLASNAEYTDKDDHLNLQHHGMNSVALQSYISLLPKNLHFEKSKAKIEIENSNPSPKNSLSTTANDFTIIEENDDYDDETEGEKNTSDEKGDELLQNAWQYKVSVQKERRALSSHRSSQTGSGRKEYCHSYDLSGKMEDQYPQNWRDEMSGISIVDCSCQSCSLLSCKGSTICAVRFYKKCLQHIHETTTNHPHGVVRMLLMNTPVKITSIALPLILSYIRSHSLPVVILVTVRSWIQSWPNSRRTQSLISLRRTCDAVFTCEGFDSIVTPPPPEFSDLAGIFYIRKMALQAQSHFADSTTNRRPPANRFGMKRDRRKLHIRMLHLPPEDFSAGGSSVGSGVRGGGGRPSQNDTQGDTALQPGLGCASNLRSKASPQSVSLDF